jgi:hypothetical protein
VTGADPAANTGDIRGFPPGDTRPELTIRASCPFPSTLEKFIEIWKHTCSREGIANITSGCLLQPEGVDPQAT